MRLAPRPANLANSAPSSTTQAINRKCPCPKARPDQCCSEYHQDRPLTLRRKPGTGCNSGRAAGIPGASTWDSSKTSEFLLQQNDSEQSKPGSQAPRTLEPNAYNYWLSALQRQQLPRHVLRDLRYKNAPYRTIRHSRFRQIMACLLSIAIGDNAYRSRYRRIVASA